MKQSKFDALSKKKLKAEFAKANAEIAGLIPKKNDAHQRKQETSTLLAMIQNYKIL